MWKAYLENYCQTKKSLKIISCKETSRYIIFIGINSLYSRIYKVHHFLRTDPENTRVIQTKFIIKINIAYSRSHQSCIFSTVFDEFLLWPIHLHIFRMTAAVYGFNLLFSKNCRLYPLTFWVKNRLRMFAIFILNIKCL